MTHKLHDYAGVYDSFGKELTHGHHVEFLQSFLGNDIARLLVEYELAQAESRAAKHDPENAVHKKAQDAESRVADATHGRMRGRWEIARYNAPIEWYAEKIVGKPVLSFHDLPALIQAQADAAMKRDTKAQRTVFDEVFENLFTTQGVSALWNQSANNGTANSGGSVPGVNAWYNNTQATIGVGDSTTAATAAQFDLQAASNRLWVAMDATYPTLPGTGSNAVVYRSTFGSAQANYAWQEFAVANDNGSNYAIPGSAARSSSNGSMLDRVVSAQGTKASGQTWQPSMTLSIS
jgi:hypothetical protein